MSNVTNGVTIDQRINPLLNLVAKKQNISNPQYDVTYTMKKGDGFMSIIYNAKVNENGKEVLSVIVKLSPDNKFFREQTNIRSLYENEILFYDEILPAFRQFQIEKGIEVFDFTAKCFAISLEEGEEGLVLENLKDKGYSVWDRMVPMDENHIELTVKTFAKYHALNFAFKDQRGEKFKEFCSKMQDVHAAMASTKMHEEAFERLMDNMINYLDPVDDKKYVGQFKNYLEFTKTHQTMFFSKNMDEYSIIGHGDCWCNNIMYKYEDSSNPCKPTNIRLLDFQIIRYATPILDFVHYFYTASPNEVQDKLEYYLELYYNTLVDFIKRLGSDPEKLYPRSVFDAHWKKYSSYGLVVAAFMIRLMTSETDEVPDLNQIKGEESMMKAMDYEPKNSGYKKRVRNIIVHFCERGLI